MTKKIDLTKITEYWQNEVAEQVSPWSCVLAARLVTKALQTLDVPCDILRCDALALNDEAVFYFSQGVPIADWSPTAWTVGANSNPKSEGTHLTVRWEGGGFDGHLIVVAQGHIIDLTAYQFDRPERGIVTGGSLLVPTSKTTRKNAPSGFGGSHYVEVPIREGKYFISPARYQNNYKCNGDWEHGYKQFLRGLLHHIRGDVHV